jgi:hypothetical protein
VNGERLVRKVVRFTESGTEGVTVMRDEAVFSGVEFYRLVLGFGIRFTI